MKNNGENWMQKKLLENEQDSITEMEAELITAKINISQLYEICKRNHYIIENLIIRIEKLEKEL